MVNAYVPQRSYESLQNIDGMGDFSSCEVVEL